MLSSEIDQLPIVDLTTNISQIFTELYKRYSLLANPPKNVFEESLYFEGKQSLSIKARLDNALRKYHEEEGTLELYINPDEPLKDQIFMAGNGSTQIYKGLIYAMATTFPDKTFLVVQKIPYFSGHRDAVSVFTYGNMTYKGYHNPSEIEAIRENYDYVVEFVTSPNNPDGKPREPLTNPDVIIGDFVFASSSFGISGDGYLKHNLRWLRKARKEGKTIFSYNSASKQFGHTADRFGYMWFPYYDSKILDESHLNPFYEKFNNFLEITVGVNLYGASNFLNLLSAIGRFEVEIRKDTNESLKKRSQILGELLKERYPGSDVTNVDGSPLMFVKIEDDRIGTMTAADVIFEDTHVKVIKGSLYGADDTYVRINIMAFSEDLAIFANRLAEEGRYTRHDFLVLSNCPPEPSRVLICARGCKPMHYVVDPNDRFIEVDATNGQIHIFLPKFLGYEPPYQVTIKRVDCTKNKVKICSDLFCFSLRKGSICLIWQQPFYENGYWTIRGSSHPPTVPEEKYENRVDLSHLYLV